MDIAHRGADRGRPVPRHSRAPDLVDGAGAESNRSAATHFLEFRNPSGLHTKEETA